MYAQCTHYAAFRKTVKTGGQKSSSKGRNKGKNKHKSKSKKSPKRKNVVPVLIEPPLLPPPPPSQGQFICLHIGQAGVQLGSACWELFCLEHGINSDGTVNQLTTNSTSMFSVTQTDTYVPRALFVDTESSVINALKNGKYQGLFSARSMISGQENAASNYAAGFYGVGRKLSSTVMNQLAHLAENCNSLQGIALFRSTGGGTGSGMGSQIIQCIKNTYPNKTILDFNVCPSSELSSAIVEPYNAVLAAHQDLDVVNCSLLFENKSLYRICASQLNLSKPTYGNINSVIALVSSGITSCLRFEGSMMSNLSELLTNLIPQPELHFPLITHAPMTNSARSYSLASTQLAAMSFDRNFHMIKVDPKLGRYLSVCMIFRGDLKPTEINTTIAFIQREQTIPVTENMYSPLFKFGLCYQPTVTVPSNGIIAPARAVTTLSNNTAVKHCWKNMLENYNKLLSKRVFLHHYTEEGMDEEMFNIANEGVSKLITHYDEIEIQQ